MVRVSRMAGSSRVHRALHDWRSLRYCGQHAGAHTGHRRRTGALAVLGGPGHREHLCGQGAACLGLRARGHHPRRRISGSAHPQLGRELLVLGGANAYNTYYLHADDRGCETCHTDGLAKPLESDTTLVHWPLDNGLGTNINVLDCLMCHNEHGRNHDGVAYSFGDLIHGIHLTGPFDGNCMTCHTATAGGNSMRLWEESKYDVLHGINDVADVTGDFYYEQETLGGYTALSLDNWGYARAFAGEQPNEEVFNSWEITVSGLVDKPFTITLGELIETAPSETFISSGQCIVNPPSGEQLCNVEVTGIPLSVIIKQAVPAATTNTVVFTSEDGYSIALPLGYVTSHLGVLVFDINGAPLADSVGGTSANYFARNIQSIQFETRETEPLSPNTPEAREIYQNLPNIGVLYGGEIR